MQVFKKYLDAFLTAIYPSKCALCYSFSADPICTICSDEFIALSKHTSKCPGENPLDFWGSLYLYKSKASLAVRRLKFNRATNLARPLANFILTGAENLDLLDVDAIVPVPIHWTRKFDRGFNQADLLCQKLPKELLNKQLIFRNRATPPQARLTTAERMSNLQGSFTASSKAEGKNILLVDDVITTGSTALECAKALKEKGANRVGILSLTGSGFFENPTARY